MKAKPKDDTSPRVCCDYRWFSLDQHACFLVPDHKGRCRCSCGAQLLGRKIENGPSI